MKLKGNLRKAPKLTYQALHPGNNKQNVPLALALFHDTTIAAAESYFPDRQDLARFLSLVNIWWNIANSKVKFSPNPLSSAIVFGDKKTEFYREFANWIDKWSISPSFTLTKQTASALSSTLRAQSLLISELLDCGYEYVLTSRLQSDPIERRFSQYRQMSGGRFLVSLREVINSERILACRSLLKANINFWDEDLREDNDADGPLSQICSLLSGRENEISECCLDHDSEEVAITISGYVVKKLTKRSSCNKCKNCFKVSDDDLQSSPYLSLLSRGGLIVPPKDVADFVCNCFAILDFVEKDISSLNFPVRKLATYVLREYGPIPHFTCEEHEEWGFNFASKIIVNIYYNNKEKLLNDEVRKDSVVGFKKRQRTK